MVRLTRIYTRQGDHGDTRLGDMSLVRKTSARVAAYGDVDELNSVMGLVRQQDLPAGWDERLARIQNDLFDLGADLAVPQGGDAGRLRVAPDRVAWLETWCDEVNAPLEPLNSFVLPGGTPAAAALHHARTVCRRAERATVALADAEPVNPHALAFLNRLSDLLFILARGANHAAGRTDVLWVPGGGEA
ncbi:MAG: cob(I)yrinic acid a,c-diamide adenosyltransferase [Thermoleophilia bacterium]|jgi:cob(I)alamin adenosyltransferase|nr:cob(I)yrinic acid a,c-diamide adenosyltransferase [Thermoleophilia bacterium]